MENNFMDPAFLISQVLAAMAFGFGIAGFQFKRRSTVLIFWFLCAILNAIHFFVLNKPEPGILAVLTSIRFLTASRFSIYWLSYLFAIVTVFFFYLFYQGNHYSFIVLAASLMGCFGSFQKNDKAVRATFMMCAHLWLIHNVLIWSPVAALMEFCFIISNIIGWRRAYRKTDDQMKKEE